MILINALNVKTPVFNLMNYSILKAADLYFVKKDPNEWYNLAGTGAYQHIIEAMRKAAPKQFSAPATPNSTLKLIIEGDTFHWEPR